MIGSDLSTGDLGVDGGPGGPDSPRFLNLSRGIAVGVALEAPINRLFDVGAGMKYAFGSDLLAGHHVGDHPCGQNCSAAVYDRT